MIIKIAICDDESNYLSNLENMLISYFENKNYILELSKFNSAKNLILDIQDGAYFDIAIIDIEMPDINGMQLAQTINDLCNDCIVMFLTSYIQYAVDAFKLKIFRYIPKTQTDSRLIPAINDAIKTVAEKQQRRVLISKYNHIENIYFDDIIYIQKNGKYSTFVCKNNREIDKRQSIIDTYKTLDKEDFIFIDRGCIVNLNNLKRIENNDVICINGDKLAISRSNQKEVKEKAIKFFS